MPLYNPPSGNGEGGGITNSAPVNTIPVTVDGEGNLGANVDVPLVDPGNVWEPSTAVTEGHRIAETVDGRLRVFEVTAGGTTSAATLFTEHDIDLTPLGDTQSGPDVHFQYLGIVGQISWNYAPGLPPEIQVTADHRTKIFHPSASDESDNFFQLLVNAGLASLFEIKTDGDADWFFDENNSPGMRWNNLGNAYFTEITSERFRVVGEAGAVEVQLNPFSVSVTGLPTSDPSVAGQVWNDNGTLKISAG